jgi:hypothetical protein
VRTRVRSLTRGPSGAWRLEGPELGAVDVDRVVLTTGHAFPNWTASTRAWRRSPPAARRPPSGCPLRAWGLRGGHGSGRPVGGSVVGVLGLGLSFYDVMAALTIGRGERFEAAGDGLQYEPSGREPLVVAGSRSGVPVPARGRNQKPPDYVYVPLLFHPVPDAPGAAARPLAFQPRRRAIAGRRDGPRPPRHRATPGSRGARRPAVPRTGHRDHRPGRPRAAVAEQARRLGSPELAALELRARAHPFAGHRFGSSEEFHRVVADHVRLDRAEAEKGNVDGPVKAALDTLRDVRAVIRVVLDHGGLTAASHRKFLASFIPWPRRCRPGRRGSGCTRCSCSWRRACCASSGRDRSSRVTRWRVGCVGTPPM